MFYQNHSFALHTVAVDIFCKLIFWNIGLGLGILDCLTGLEFTLWYTGLGLKKYLNYLTEPGQYFDILELDLESA